MRKVEQPDTPNIHITEIVRTEEKGMAGTGTIDGQPCTITTIENVSDRSRINITMHSPDGKTPPKTIEGQEALDLLKDTQPTYDEKIIPHETKRFTRAVERNKAYENRKEVRAQQRKNRDKVRAEQRKNRDQVRAERKKARNGEINAGVAARIAELQAAQR